MPPAHLFIRQLSTKPTLPRVIRTVAEYRSLRNEWAVNRQSVGFVPTMGALHEGHLSLARHSKRETSKTVASIFVNPAQFAPTEDLDKYPRTFESDLELLAKEGVDVVFAPTVSEMYPAGICLDVDKQVGTFVEVKGRSHQLEGKIRPHFFRGVATVVTKLLNATQPTKAFFGQKDGQQCAVIRSMVRDLLMPTEIVVCETIREPDGLAMSSRNRYLSAEERAVAPVLYKGLVEARKLFESGERRGEVLVDSARKVLEAEKRVQIQYLSVANSLSLEEEKLVGKDGAMMSGAILVGKTRIIDNILLGVDVRGWKA
ncbi:pantothenate synthase [Chytridiales sp. JEL 0842]|nr:pantothenate synthase [Chytridiales sp. JEL 0842]